MRNTLSKTKQCLVTLLAVGTLWTGLGLSEAFAGDEKRYPGTFCKPANNNLANFAVGSGISVYNKSTTDWLTVYCPIIRDEMAWNDKLEWVNVDYFNPYHKNRQVICWVQSRDPKGGKLISSSYLSNSPSYRNGTGTIGISWNKYSWHYFYMLGCVLPPSGDLTKAGTSVKLNGYWVSEK